MLKSIVNSPVRSGDQTVIDGNMVIGTDGKGLDFSSSSHAPGMTSELLNDYEEGTWTPTDASGAGLVFSDVQAHYVKIGRYVMASGQITFPVTVDVSTARIGGLPFQSGPDGTRTAFISYNNAGANSMNFTAAGTNALYINTSAGALLNNAVCSGKVFYFAASYISA